MKNFIYIFMIAEILTSCSSTNNNDNLKAEANKARIMRFYEEVLNAHNPSMVDSFCVSDFIDHNPDQGHTGKGLDDLKAGLNDFFTAFPDFKIKSNFMIASGDSVMVHMTMTGTNTGSMAGMPATGKQVSVDGVDIILLKDGKATERWGYFDMIKFMTQLGLMPEPGAIPDSSMMKK